MIPNNNESESIQAIDTSFRLIEFIKERDGTGVTKIAQELDIAKSTAHRHLQTLEKLRYVRRGDDEFHVGLRFMDLGIYARDRHPLYSTVKPRVDQLAEETGERVVCMVEEHGIGIFLYGASGEHPVRPPIRAGQQRYLHLTAAGKAILAHLPLEQVDEIIERYGLPAQTEQTITDPEELANDLEQIRDRGYAFNLEEAFSGLHAIGAPIRNSTSGTVLGSISITGPANRINVETMEGELAELLLGTTNEIEINVSYA